MFRKMGGVGARERVSLVWKDGESADPAIVQALALLVV